MATPISGEEATGSQGGGGRWRAMATVARNLDVATQARLGLGPRRRRARLAAAAVTSPAKAGVPEGHEGGRGCSSGRRRREGESTNSPRSAQNLGGHRLAEAGAAAATDGTGRGTPGKAAGEDILVQYLSGPLCPSIVTISQQPPQLSTLCTGPHWAFCAQRDRSPRLGTGPRELQLGSRVRVPVSPRETGPRETGSFLRDRFPRARFSGLSQIFAFLTGITFKDWSLPARDRLHQRSPQPQPMGPVPPC
uniref:Uncharacterized protein n=1 Tax=Ananas comosus var. bracteatus TaxID=296719 RepID=A0A6V7PS73_ANACO|nr:unnamed protein product [Ananas comosus var. bracteatus]